MPLFTVPTTGIYRSTDGQDVRYFVAGTILDVVDAVRFGMAGATTPAAAAALNPEQIALVQSTSSTVGSALIATEERRITRGLVKSNPAVSRLLPPVGVMASAPTITPGTAGAATTIASAVSIDEADVRLRYFGTRTGHGAGAPDNSNYAPSNIASTTDTTQTLHSTGSWGVEFEFYGSKFELAIKGNGATACYRLNVLGQGVDALIGRADTAADGLTYFILYDFGSADFRRIRFEFDGGVHFYGLRIGPTDTIMPPSWDLGDRWLAIGDSFTEPTGAVAYRGWVHAMAEALGVTNVVPSGSGGTGYLQTNGTRTTFRGRVQRDVINAAPDVVLVAGGINDTAFTAAQVGTEAALLFAAIRAGLPNATLIVLSPFWPNGSPTAIVMQIRDALRTSALAAGAALFVDAIGGLVPYGGATSGYVNAGWITGAGRVGATTGSGNADLFTGTDATHPTTTGHQHLGRRVAAAIVAGLPL